MRKLESMYDGFVAGFGSIVMGLFGVAGHWYLSPGSSLAYLTGMVVSATTAFACGLVIGRVNDN